MSRPRKYTEVTYSDSEIDKSIRSMGVTSWVSSMVEGVLKNVRLHHSDFMGNDRSIVSVEDVVFSMFFYAFKVGRKGGDQQWEEECYEDFIKREKVFDRILKKIDNFSTKSGLKKISEMKKTIRMSVESRERLQIKEIDTLGVFTEVPEMEEILSSTKPADVVRQLQGLGDHPESDPRYYIHTIFRYHMNELHQILADNNKVVRFPSMQKMLDIVAPVSSNLNLPPEFREFMRKLGGSSSPVVSLPLPSKTRGNSVVYGSSFEDLRWVRVMRQQMFKIFSDWKSSTSTVYIEIYPRYLIQGDPHNKGIAEIMAKSVDIESLKKNLDSFETMDMDIFLEAAQYFPEVVNIFDLYRNKVFNSPGEQLRERRGFFMHSSTRGVFQGISKKVPTFCDDVYMSLNLNYETIEEFYEYCQTKKIRKFTIEDQEMWRTFLFILERICMVFNVYSRRQEVESFFSEHGTTEAYIAKMVNSGIV